MAKNKIIDDFCVTVGNKVGAIVSAGEDGTPVAIPVLSIISLIGTMVPTILGWFKSCKDAKNNEVQPQVAAANFDPKQAEKQRRDLAGKLLKECKRLKTEEKRNAKKNKVPADVGRYMLDTPCALRVADHMIGTFVAMKPEKAFGLCQAIEAEQAS